MGIDCNHDCTRCPAHLIYGGNPTQCRIINKVLDVLDCEKQTEKQRYENALKEGEK